MDYVCNFLNHNGSYIGPRITIYRSSLDSAIEEAFERLAAHPEYQGFDLLQDGIRRHRFSRNQALIRASGYSIYSCEFFTSLL
jgi:hypothetical protein